MTDKKSLMVIIEEIETALVERGQSENSISQYHYIFRVFLSYSRSFGEEVFNRKILERCLREHYKIADESVLSRKQHYKKKVLRAFQMLCDSGDGRPFENRYMVRHDLVITEEYTNAVTDYIAAYQRSGHSPKTLELYRGYAERFLNYAEQNNVCRFANITAELISKYTLTLSDYHKGTVKSTLGGLRLFFKFLYTNESVGRDLSILVTSIKVRTNTKIPSVWSKDEVMKLLAAIDRGNPSGKRDYAILLLVTRLGIRVGDINSLKFENIDWRKNSIAFIQGKTQNVIRLPLLKDVGWAIIDYIQNGRPKIDSPFVFLTHIPPFKGYSSENHLHATIAKYMDIAGIQNQTNQKRGMHSLRHTLANRLLENHESMHIISSALGHSSPDSADVYLKTDIELLRECALSPSEVGI